MSSLTEDLQAHLAAAGEALKTFAPTPIIAERGVVEGAGDGIVIISGLPSARLDELLAFDNDRRAVVVSLGRRVLRAVMLDPAEGILAGMSVRGTEAVVQVPLGPALQGRIVDPLGRPLDGVICKGMRMFNDRRRSPPNSSTSLPAPKRFKSHCESPVSPGMGSTRRARQLSPSPRPEGRPDATAMALDHPHRAVVGSRMCSSSCGTSSGGR